MEKKNDSILIGHVYLTRVFKMLTNMTYILLVPPCYKRLALTYLVFEGQVDKPEGEEKFVRC